VRRRHYLERRFLTRLEESLVAFARIYSGVREFLVSSLEDTVRKIETFLCFPSLLEQGFAIRVQKSDLAAHSMRGADPTLGRHEWANEDPGSANSPQLREANL